MIIQAAGSEVSYAGGYCFVEMVKQVGRDFNVPVAVHLDHGASFEEACNCIRYGFTSVMFDGSSLPFEKNIEVTRKLKEVTKAVGVTLEGELGTIGQTTEMGEYVKNAYLTDPEAAKAFVESTGVDCIAVAIGNAHGLYKDEPNLDFDRLRKIRELVNVPIVMHGGTGLPEAQIKKSITMGIAKINFSTALRKAYIDNIKKYMAEHPEDLMVMNIFNYGSAGFQQAVEESIRMCGSENKA